MTDSTRTARQAAAAGVAGPGRVPDFFVVGHPKCGTTAMYEMLRAHPGIFMPELKEPRYFDTDMRQRFVPRRQGPLPTTIEAYTSLFEAAPSRQLVGEASPSYLVSHTAAGLIAEAQPHARIIAILREPASFLRSLHLQLVQSHMETVKDLRRAIELEPARLEGRRIPRRSHRPQALHYSDNVRYVDQLRRYHEVFPPEQVLVLIYDDYRADNEGTMRRILRFLEVDDTVPIAARDVNPSVLVRSQQLEEAMNATAVGQGPISNFAKAAIKTVVPRRVRRGAFRRLRRGAVLSEPKPVDESYMLELRRRFKPEVAALGEYLDRDLLGLWGYDELG
jgi:hypothetical protein